GVLMDPVVFLAAALGAIAVVGVIIAIGAMASPRDEVLDRVERLTSGSGGPAALPVGRPAAGGSILGALLRPLARLATPRPGEELSRMRARLTHAGYRSER